MPDARTENSESPNPFRAPRLEDVGAVRVTPRRRRRIALVAFAACLLILGYALAEPQSKPGIALFRAAYWLAYDKSVVLGPYHRQIAFTNNVEIVDEVDEQLCEQLMVSTDRAEQEAILDFYVSQAGWREGRRIAKLGRPLVAMLMLRMRSTHDELKLNSTLILIENARRGENLYKPFAQRSADELVPFYEAWWASHDSWEDLRQVDPLAGQAPGWRSP